MRKYTHCLRTFVVQGEREKIYTLAPFPTSQFPHSLHIPLNFCVVHAWGQNGVQWGLTVSQT